MEEFSFPFEPYDIQLSLMRSITRCIDERKIGILESPTGTGKSMSVICATLTWLQKHEAEQKAYLEEQLKKVEEAGKDENDWVQAHMKKSQAISDAKDLFDQLDNNKKIEERVRKALENSTHDRKRKYADDDDSQQKGENDADEILVDDYASDNDNDDDGDGAGRSVKKVAEEPVPKCQKIIYATRTHSQLQQFANEIMKTGFRPRMVTLGSRQQFCVNESVRALHSAGLMTERCNELRDNKSSVKRQKGEESECLEKTCKEKCPFARSDAIEDLCDQLLATKLSKVSQLVDYGKKVSGCPYFGSRKAVAYSQLVMLPYQILLQEDARKAWGVDLKDNVVVIDEAHNLLEIVASSHSVTLHVEELQSAHRILNLYVDRYRSRLKPVHLKYLRQLITLTDQLLRYIDHEVDVSKLDHAEKMTSFATKSYLGQYKLYSLLDYIEQTHLIAKLNKFSKRVNKENRNDEEYQFGVERLLKKRASSSTVCSKSEDTSTAERKDASPFSSLKQFLQLMTLKYDDSRIIIECSAGKDHAKIRYFLINPASQLNDLIEQCRCLILVGGTMEPSDQLIRSLVHTCKVQPENIIRQSYGHVISERQLLAVTIGQASDVELMFTYDKRSNPKVMYALMGTLQKIARTVPNGMIVFFPSYGYLEQFIGKMTVSSLQKIKPTFCERRNSPSILFDEYAKWARTEKGALLIAVVGGKLSEGINFSDELGRAVVIVGLPFINKDDVAVKEKLKYLDTEYGKGSAASYYESKCMHAINQSIGRVIRHRDDYAAIVMLDVRYRKPQIVKGLPSWIQSRVYHATNLIDGVAHVTRFYGCPNNCQADRHKTSAK